MPNYVAEAEAVIQDLCNKGIILNTNQLRKILSAITEIKNKVNIEVAKNKAKVKTISPELQMEIRFLKTHFCYQAGREIEENKGRRNAVNTVDEFIKRAKLIPYLDKIGDDIDNFKEYCKYIESLVAFHKYYSATYKHESNVRGGR